MSELLEDSDSVVYQDSSEPPNLLGRMRVGSVSVEGKKCVNRLQLLQQAVEFIKRWGETV